MTASLLKYTKVSAADCALQKVSQSVNDNEMMTVTAEDLKHYRSLL
jgi:hypothetical protein